MTLILIKLTVPFPVVPRLCIFKVINLDLFVNCEDSLTS